MSNLFISFHRLMARIPKYVVSAVGLVLLLLLTLLPGKDLPSIPAFPLADKWAHILAFGLVSVALLFDVGRMRGCIGWRSWLCIGAAMTALGVLVESLQQSMGVGRSADVYDVVADALGAFLLPLMFWPLVNGAVNAYVCDLVIFDGKASVLSNVRTLYMESFPPEERRPWEALAGAISNPSAAISLIIIRSRGCFAGFISWWNLGGVRYVEHFAIEAARRGEGIGAAAIRKFAAMSADPVVLEVEPESTGDMARRRIRFYRRCGFVAHPEHEYVQPPYSPELPAVRMMLMTVGGNVNLHDVSGRIYRRVYGVKQ